MDLRLRKLVCLNEAIIPFQQELATHMDGDEFYPDSKFLLLEIQGGTKNMTWLLKPLGLQKNWHRYNFSKIAFISEVLTMIKSKKNTKRAAAKFPDAVIEINVRGKALLVRNRVKGVTLAFKPDETSEHALSNEDMVLFEWIIQELSKDVGAMAESELEVKDDEVDAPEPADSDTEPAPKRQKACSGSWFGIQSLDKAILDVLEALGKLPSCKCAIWQTSRTSFKVTRKNDGRQFEFFMSASIGRKVLQKIRAESEQDLTSALETAIAGIMAIIDKVQDVLENS